MPRGYRKRTKESLKKMELMRKVNNKNENLMLMKKSDHARLHAKKNNKKRKRNQKGQYS